MPLFRQFNQSVAKLNSHVLIWLIAALVFGALWLHTLRLISDDRASAQLTAETEIVNLARVSQEHAERIFYSADQALRLVRTEYLEQAHEGQLDLNEMRAQGVFDEKTILQVSLLDAHGILKMSSAPGDDPIDWSDRPYFRMLAAAAADDLVIMPAMPGRIAGTWTVHMARRISDKKGQFGRIANSK